ncbi:hypothetical protein IE81DRAFT_346123 [Ceraceosorus guamensis]|uniref:Uncharacterized protein n=1 Tax=Ceraceosorus guamensis TaxID=1522189 RepID=A0A316W2G9_9BASI|nr:hypothetical protein IE81DRAFT_346123 [Ceraceosorus guamensis]PWN43960.1 hypothetical protein IE81DRAFT_346123 [Ceraceosorus guamensis]
MSLRTFFDDSSRLERPARMAKSRRATLIGASSHLDQTAGEGLRRSVLLRNAITRTREQEQLPPFNQEPSYDRLPDVTTSDYDYEALEDEAGDEERVRRLDQLAWLDESHDASIDNSTLDEGNDDEARFFDDLLEELGSTNHSPPKFGSGSGASSTSLSSWMSSDVSSCKDIRCDCQSLGSEHIATACTSSIETLPSLIEDDAESDEASDSEDESTSVTLDRGSVIASKSDDAQLQEHDQLPKPGKCTFAGAPHKAPGQDALASRFSTSTTYNVDLDRMLAMHPLA